MLDAINQLLVIALPGIPFLIPVIVDFRSEPDPVGYFHEIPRIVSFVPGGTSSKLSVIEY